MKMKHKKKLSEAKEKIKKNKTREKFCNLKTIFYLFEIKILY